MPEFELIGSSISRIFHLQIYFHNYPTFSEASSDLDYSLTHLSTQIALLHNAIVLILTKVTDEDDLVDLLKNPTGNHWKSPLVENKARVGLGQNYGKFFDRMSQLQLHLNVIFEVFKLHARVSVEVRPQIGKLVQDILTFKCLQSQSSLDDLESKTDNQSQPDLLDLNMEKLLTGFEDINHDLWLIADYFTTSV